MTKMRWFSRIGFVIICLAVLGFGCDRPSGSFGEHREGYAPDFVLPVLSFTPQKEKTLRLSDLSKDRPVLISFWATWCPSCIEKMSILNQWHAEYGKSGQLFVIGVNVQESQKHVKQFLEENPVDYPILLDEEGEVSSAFGLTELPVTVLLAKGGKIIYYGFSLPTDLQELISAG